MEQIENCGVNEFSSTFLGFLSFLFMLWNFVLRQMNGFVNFDDIRRFCSLGNPFSWGKFCNGLYLSIMYFSLNQNVQFRFLKSSKRYRWVSNPPSFSARFLTIAFYVEMYNWGCENYCLKLWLVRRSSLSFRCLPSCSCLLLFLY